MSRSASELARIVGTAALFAASLGAAAESTTHVDQVWALEDHYWDYVQRGDEADYLTLWHDDFLGWPCSFNAPHPAGKPAIGAWVRRIHDERIRFSYALQHEAAHDFGSIVVVHYSTPQVFEYPDGRVTGKGVRYKVTHTWMQVGATWQIIGGMCAPLA